MARRSLNPDENERVREGLRQLLRRFESQTALAQATGISQATISNINGGKPTSFATARAIAGALGITEQDLLAGRQGHHSDRRAVAAELAREDGIIEDAIQSVLAEPLHAADAHRSALWWAIRMKRREIDLLGGPPPPEG